MPRARPSWPLLRTAVRVASARRVLPSASILILSPSRALCYHSPVKILLVAINAKYVQTNLAVRLLASYARRVVPAVADGTVSVEKGEWNVNEPAGQIVRGIVEREPDVVLFSTYIWNRGMVFRVMSDVRKLLPGVLLGAGGPEVSWNAEKDVREHSELDLVISGEGELTLVELIRRLADGLPLAGTPGTYVRSGGEIVFGGAREPMIDLGEIPFPYASGLLDFDPTNRIVYYESSRGCPFSCAYCLSSIDRAVRYYPLERVLSDIKYFLEEGFPLVKFTDRTFNLAPERYLAIWKFIRDHYNGTTRFHFELSADLLADDAFAVLETMPEGSVQFEIGIQSTNAETLRLVGRKSDVDRLAANVRRIPAAIHRHVDLIAGLPAEDLPSFSRSFDFAFALGADMLQLGFLKILDGSPMAAIARAEAGPSGYAWSAEPPYEVLRSPAMPYRDLLAVKDVECLVDAWYNTGLLRNFLTRLAADGSAFALFRELASFVRGYFADGDLYLPRRPADIFACAHAFLMARLANAGVNAYTDEWLRYDFLLQGKPGAFPAWYERRYDRDAHDAALLAQGFLGTGESRRTLYARTEYDRFRFSPEEGEFALLFEYRGEKKNEKKAICRRV